MDFIEIPRSGVHPSEADVPISGTARENRKILLASYSFWFALKTRRVTSSSSIFNLAKGSSGRQAPAKGESKGMEYLNERGSPSGTASPRCCCIRNNESYPKGGHPSEADVISLGKLSPY